MEHSSNDATGRREGTSAHLTSIQRYKYSTSHSFTRFTPHDSENANCRSITGSDSFDFNTCILHRARTGLKQRRIAYSSSIHCPLGPSSIVAVARGSQDQLVSSCTRQAPLPATHGTRLEYFVLAYPNDLELAPASPRRDDVWPVWPG
jgi:hypothetical protein